MQLVALPEDERSLPRTQADYGEPYSPSYVESEKEYLSALANSLRDYGKPGADPLAMPIDIGAGAITANQIVKKLSNPGRKYINEFRELHDALFAPPATEKQLRTAFKESGDEVAAKIKGIPKSILDFVDDVKYMDNRDEYFPHMIDDATNAYYKPKDRLIALSPYTAAKISTPESAAFELTHEATHAAANMLRSLYRTEIDEITHPYYADDILYKNKLDDYAIKNSDEIRILNDTTGIIENPYTLNYPQGLLENYRSHPEERLAQAAAINVTGLNPARSIDYLKNKGFAVPQIQDLNLAKILYKLFSQSK